MGSIQLIAVQRAHLPNPHSASEQQEVDTGTTESRGTRRRGRAEVRGGQAQGLKSLGRGQESTQPGKARGQGTARQAFWKGNWETLSRDPEEQHREGWSSLRYKECGELRGP